MIYAELSGGLGNQMFVYAFARAMGLCCQEPVTLIDRQDWKTGSPGPHCIGIAGTAYQLRGAVHHRCRLCQAASAGAERRQGPDDPPRTARGPDGPGLAPL